MDIETRKVIIDPLFNNNPIALQILGICSALAVTTKLSTALVMSLALTSVVACSNVAISIIRNHIPSSIRIIVQMVIISSLVIVVDQLLKAFLFEISKQLSVSETPDAPCPAPGDLVEVDLVASTPHSLIGSRRARDAAGDRGGAGIRTLRLKLRPRSADEQARGAAPGIGSASR